MNSRVICKTLGNEAFCCAAAIELPATASDNPNRMGLILFMYTFLLRFGPRARAMEEAGETREGGRSETWRLWRAGTLSVKSFLRRLRKLTLELSLKLRPTRECGCGWQ